jgi:hypothetical protein
MARAVNFDWVVQFVFRVDFSPWVNPPLHKNGGSDMSPLRSIVRTLPTCLVGFQSDCDLCTGLGFDYNKSRKSLDWRPGWSMAVKVFLSMGKQKRYSLERTKSGGRMS